MTISDRQFKREMKRAQLFIHSADREYWEAYIRGLKRKKFGNKYVSDHEHERLLNASNSQSIKTQWIGNGYLHGLQFDNLPSGRPSIGSELLPSIKVPLTIKEGLYKKSKELHMSLPAIRRKAYEVFISS